MDKKQEEDDRLVLAPEWSIISAKDTPITVLLSHCGRCPAANCHVPGCRLMHVDEYVLVIATSCMRFDVREHV